MMPGTCICRMSSWDEVERKRMDQVLEFSRKVPKEEESM